MSVTVEVGDLSAPVGVFGHYECLILRFDKSIGASHEVWAQDLLADRAADVTEQVLVDDQTIEISGDVIDRIGTSAATEGDLSAPGLVLRILP